VSRGVALGLASIALAVLAACGESSSTSSSGPAAGTAGVNVGSPTVTIMATDQNVFTPTNPTVHVGDVIQWTVPGTTNHTVTFISQSTLTDVSLVPGGTWEVKFTTPGTYAYICAIHPGMNGSIIVS
jgi:plastocyanin